MPETTMKYKAVNGFVLSGNLFKHTIESGEEFSIDEHPNKFGCGRNMVTVYDGNGEAIGYVTQGQAQLIRQGGV
jgi:hypothetical protein